MRKLAGIAAGVTLMAAGGLAVADGADLQDPARPAHSHAVEARDLGAPAGGPFAGETPGSGDARPASAMPQRRGSSQPLGARVVRTTALRAAPGGRVVARVGRRTTFRGPQILAVVARRGRWLGVLHEALPNGRAGWIAARDARLYSEPWRIVVDRSERTAVVRRRGRVVERFRVGIGTAESPTPLGRFAVTDRLVTEPGSVYGCCILALSGRQPDLPAGWRGGDRLALHGDRGDARVGRAASAGCLVASRAVMERLLARLPVGTRVDIRA